MRHDEMGDPTLRDGRDGEWWHVAVQVRVSWWVLRGRVTSPACKTTRPRYSFYMSPNFHRDPRS